jgi:hypothetical protein
VTKEGRVSEAFAFGGGNRQVELLKADGVGFVDGQVDMERFQWETPWIERKGGVIREQRQERPSDAPHALTVRAVNSTWPGCDL